MRIQHKGGFPCDLKGSYSKLKASLRPPILVTCRDRLGLEKGKFRMNLNKVIDHVCVCVNSSNAFNDKYPSLRKEEKKPKTLAIKEKMNVVINLQ
jgi:hypothetical protein